MLKSSRFDDALAGAVSGATVLRCCLLLVRSSVCDGGVQREAAAPSSAAISNAGG